MMMMMQSFIDSFTEGFSLFPFEAFRSVILRIMTETRKQEEPNFYERNLAQAIIQIDQRSKSKKKSHYNLHNTARK